MSIYISVFLSSTVFLYAGEKIKDKKLNRFLIVIGLLIPSIIAACRADSVGTDVLVYGKAFYTQAVSSSSFITYVISKVDSMFSDFGFYFLTYILSRFFKDYHIGFFVYAILVNYIVNMVLMFALVKKAYNVLKLKSTRKKEMIIFCNSDQKKFIRILVGSRKIILEIWIRNMIFL